VSAAVIDDALSLVLLAVLTAVIETGSIPDLSTFLLIAGRITLFFTVAVVIGTYAFPPLGRFLKRLHLEESDFSMLLIAALAYATLAELLGVHFILGAFMAGLLFGRRTVLASDYEAVRKRLKGVTTGFFAPVFFAGIGLHLSGAALLEVPGFVIVLIAAAVLSKLVGAGLAARATGMKTWDSVALGTAMSSRGAVELIIAEIALRAGLFSTGQADPVIHNLFSSVVIMAITTTILAPMILRRLLPARG
jgi:Kef-type K+ transport system membrane component KefB